MSIPKYEVCIVGCGNIAGGYDEERDAEELPLSHAKGFGNHEAFKLTACVDPDEERRHKFAHRWSVESSYKCIQDCLDEGREFDVVTLCSPTAMHYEHVLQALKLKPKVIFCEKPLSYSAETVAEMYAVCKASNVKLITNFSRQWDRVLGKFLHEMSNAEWGPIRSIVGYYNKGLFNNGSHLLEILIRLFGDMDIVEITDIAHDGMKNDPSIGFVLKSQERKTPINVALGHARDYALFELEYVTERAVLRMEQGGWTWRVRQVEESENFKGYAAPTDIKMIPGGYSKAMTNAVCEIYEFLENNSPVSSDCSLITKTHSLCSEIRARAELGLDKVNS